MEQLLFSVPTYLLKYYNIGMDLDGMIYNFCPTYFHDKLTVSHKNPKYPLFEYLPSLTSFFFLHLGSTGTFHNFIIKLSLIFLQFSASWEFMQGCKSLVRYVDHVSCHHVSKCCRALW